MNLLDQRSNNELAAERELMQRCVEGNRQAFAILYGHYAPLLYKAVYPLTNKSKEDTEEIIQELFVKIWERRDNLLTIHSFRPFIFRLARNKVIDWYRKNASKKSYCTFYTENYRDQAPSVTDDLLFEEYYAIAMEAIAKLPPRQQQIFNLRHTDDLSLSEIAEELRISVHAVKKQLYQASRFVKEYLHKHGEWLVSMAFLFFFGN